MIKYFIIFLCAFYGLAGFCAEHDVSNREQPKMVAARWENSATDRLSAIHLILKKFANYNDFIADPKAVSEVAIQLHAYFDNGRPLNEYKVLLAQDLPKLIERYPEIYDELLKPSGQHEISIHVPLSSLNRTAIDSTNLNKALTDHLTGGNVAYDLPATFAEMDSRNKEAIEYIRRVDQQLTKYFIERENTASKKQQRQQDAAFIAKLINDQFYIALKTILLFEMTGHKKTSSFLRISSIPEIFYADYEKAITAKIDSLTHQHGFSRFIADRLKRLLPDRKMVLQRTDLFPVVQRETQRNKKVPEERIHGGTYRIRPYPAKFIGLFTRCESECIEGKDIRRLVALLSGIETYSLEFRDKSNGYIREVPWIHKQTGQIIFSNEISTENALFFREYLKAANFESADRSTLAFEWLQHFYPTRVRAISPQADATGASFQSLTNIKNYLSYSVVLGANVDFRLNVPNINSIENKMTAHNALTTVAIGTSYGPGIVTTFRNGHMRELDKVSRFAEPTKPPQVFQIVPLSHSCEKLF